MDDVRDADVLGVFWLSFHGDVVLLVFRVTGLVSLRLKQTEGANGPVWTRAQHSLVLLVLERLDRRECACVHACVRAGVRAGVRAYVNGRVSVGVYV